MMRSMFSGVSSLRVHQTRMDVIANNIANVNTTGFKAQRALFTDAFYQNLQGATGPDRQSGRPGMNAQQIGLGLNMGSIDNIMTQGASQRTDNPLDLAINGHGFFIVNTGAGTAFTRAGNVELDRAFNLHINGMSLMGWDTRRDTNTGEFVVDRSRLVPLNLGGAKQNMPAATTTVLDIIGNLDRDHTDGLDSESRPYLVRSLQIFDSLGNAYVVDVRFTFHEAPSTAAGSPHSYWTFEFIGGGDGEMHGWRDGIRTDANGDPIQPAILGVSANGQHQLTGATAPTVPFEGLPDGHMGKIAFDINGQIVGVGAWDGSTLTAADGFDTTTPNTNFVPFSGPGAQPWELLIAPVDFVNPSAVFGAGSSINAAGEPSHGTIIIRPDRLTAAAGNTRLRFDSDGNVPGTLRDISVGADGTIIGRYTNGVMRILGQIPLAVFDNPAGLERAGNNLWLESANSGGFDGLGEIGSMQGGALEMSNVDLAAEFTEMIVTQRGFQAASRTITVSDEMLQELVNLRR